MFFPHLSTKSSLMQRHSSITAYPNFLPFSSFQILCYRWQHFADWCHHPCSRSLWRVWHSIRICPIQRSMSSLVFTFSFCRKFIACLSMYATNLINHNELNPTGCSFFVKNMNWIDKELRYLYLLFLNHFSIWKIFILYEELHNKMKLFWLSYSTDDLFSCPFLF